MMQPALRSLMVAPGATLLDALRCIDEGARGIAFVCDPGGRVLGTLTDGDVRRALLRGAALDRPGAGKAMRRKFTSVSPREGRPEVLDLMRARSIDQVPVLDAQGRLVGLHSLQELVGGAERPNWAVIMAGGKGVRLRPITENIPKPMIRVAGRPILERLVLHLTGSGIRRIFLSVNYLSHVIEDHFGDGNAFGCRIEYLRERKPLGTGGALALLPERPRHPLLVMNGDLVTQFDVGRMVEAHERAGNVATFGMRPYQVEIPFGVVEVKGDRLVGLREKPSERMMINAGIYVLGRRALRLVPKGLEFPITDLFTTCLSRGLRVGAHLIQDEWTDVGRHEELKRARGDG